MWRQGAEADIAQMAEYLFCTQSVAGSSPGSSARIAAHVHERGGMKTTLTPRKRRGNMRGPERSHDAAPGKAWRH